MFRPARSRRALSPGVLIVGLVLLVALIGAAFWVPRIFTGGVVGPEASPTAPERQAEVAATYEAAVRDGDTGGVNADDLPGLTPNAQGVAFVALRADGVRLADAWGTGFGPSEAVRGALSAARADLAADQIALIDAVELNVIGALTTVDLTDSGALADDAHRGIVGLQVELDGVTHRVAPTSMIAANTSFDRVVELLAEENAVTQDEVRAAPAHIMETSQYLLAFAPPAVSQMYRGNQVVVLESVTRRSADALAGGLLDWLVANCGDDGRIVYEYHPSRGEETSDNNMIRQWMATIALETAAAALDDASLYQLARRNIEYNLGISYSLVGELGHIADPDGEVKLGALALAALAISRHPDRGAFGEQEAALRRSVDALWQTDGSFRTFLVPADRNDNQNFYPGEALLLWAVTLEEQDAGAGMDDELLRRFMQSFAYYREFHRADPNPAFVPWHTMAYEKVWRITGDPQLAQSILDMNDWLTQLQQWDGAPPDLAGRFYDPDRPQFGEAHASSDGVYMEGLIAAMRTAVGSGDEAAAERYRLVLLRGLRNAMQLQFADGVDMFYVSQRDRVAGGMRTTQYDNRIRVDNVQHHLLAVLGMLQSLSGEDWLAP